MRVTDQGSTRLKGIDKNIFFYQDALSSLPRSCHHRRGALLLNLAMLRFDRFRLSNDDRDLETSMFQFTHAIFLPFYGRLATKENLITFYLLVAALFSRTRRYKQSCDVSYCIKYLHFLRESSHKVPSYARASFTTSLICALALQIELEQEPGNVSRSCVEVLDEMSGLCHDLFSLDTSEQELKQVIDKFAYAVTILTDVQLNQPSQQVIEFLCEANGRLPDVHRVPFALFTSYFIRFILKESIDDYENAMAVLDKILALHPSPYLERALRRSVILAERRFNVYGNPEYLEEAIFRYRAHLNSTSYEGQDRSDTTQSLVNLERRRFKEFGVTGGPPEVQSGDPDVDLYSFSKLASSLAKSDAIESPLMTIDDCHLHLKAVSKLRNITDKADLEGAAKYCRLVLTSIQQSFGNDTVTIVVIRLSGEFFYHAFEQTSNPAYLNEAVDVLQGILKVPRTQWHSLHLLVIRKLIDRLINRLDLFGYREDYDQIMRLSPIAATDTHLNITIRIWISCNWARIAARFGHPSASMAYKNAMSLIQDFLTFAPTLEMQHFRFVSMDSDIKKLPLEYAAYYVNNGQLKEAIEILEQGRGLFWSELRGMRTSSIDRLCTADLRLGGKFVTINRDLEALTTSAPGAPTFWSNDNGIDSGEGMDPFGHTVVKQRKLLAERSSLITQIRSLPGFENFLMPPSFETLRSAAVHGPVIIINICRWRSDIIILLHNHPPSLVPAKYDSYDLATGLKEQLLDARKKGLESKAYEDALTSVLMSLYDLIGRPVIQKFRELKIPEQSRIWWCPTSDICSLPLHAMGPVRSEGALKLYFSDLYIPSYTPTLSALIESRTPGPHSFEKPSILLVAQPGGSMPAAWSEVSLVRNLETTVTTLCSKKATPSAVMQHLQNHRFAHFTCHGMLDTGKPFDAAFKLYREEHLTLREIIRSRLPSAEFAFLSACHTAELTEGSIADEGLHLSAAVQYSGFRSVVGTMWAMADMDGHVITKHFYASLFSERWKDVPYYARTAEALRDAVKKLRMKGVTTERWVNFVHYGA